MSNVTNNSATLAAATTNFGLLNQLMLTIGGVRADIVSSDPYNRGLPLLFRYYYKLPYARGFVKSWKKFLTVRRANFVIIITITIIIVPRCCYIFDIEKIDQKKTPKAIRCDVILYYVCLCIYVVRFFCTSYKTYCGLCREGSSFFLFFDDVYELLCSSS